MVVPPRPPFSTPMPDEHAVRLAGPTLPSASTSWWMNRYDDLASGGPSGSTQAHARLSAEADCGQRRQFAAASQAPSDVSVECDAMAFLASALTSVMIAFV